MDRVRNLDGVKLDDRGLLLDLDRPAPAAARAQSARLLVAEGVVVLRRRLLPLRLLDVEGLLLVLGVESCEDSVHLGAGLVAAAHWVIEGVEVPGRHPEHTKGARARSTPCAVGLAPAAGGANVIAPRGGPPKPRRRRRAWRGCPGVARLAPCAPARGEARRSNDNRLWACVPCPLVQRHVPKVPCCRLLLPPLTQTQPGAAKSSRTGGRTSGPAGQ